MFGNLKIDNVYETDVISLENSGMGVAKINKMVVFIPKALPGERVSVRITKIKKNYANGKLVNIIDKSKYRVKSLCPYYDECGGCNLRHQKDCENTNFKRQKVQMALKKIGKIDFEVDKLVECIKKDNYRNKASFKVEHDKIGFYEEGTYRLIDIENCMLLNKNINDFLSIIRSYIKNNYNEIKSIMVRYGNAKDEILADIYSLHKEDIKIKDYLIDNYKNVSTIIFNDKIVYGKGYIKEISNGLLFECSAKSFFQVNNIQMEKLYELAIKLSKLKLTDVALDLYCGTGTISNIISSYIKKVIGIEIVNDAVKDAINNSKINNINNTKFICGDVKKEIKNIKEKINIIFVDPPRSGLDNKTISIIKKIKPERITYISCNPVTMARDLSLMLDLYELKTIVPVDMFPNTYHVECVCILNIRKLL